MARKDPERDPFERIWERIASVVGTLRALSQPDSSAIEDILRGTAAEFSNERVKIPPNWLTGAGLAAANADNCAKSAANNLDKLVSEKPDIDELPVSERNMVRDRLRDVASLVSGAELQMVVSYDVSERLRLARKTFTMNFG